MSAETTQPQATNAGDSLSVDTLGVPALTTARVLGVLLMLLALAMLIIILLGANLSVFLLMLFALLALVCGWMLLRQPVQLPSRRVSTAVPASAAVPEPAAMSRQTDMEVSGAKLITTVPLKHLRITYQPERGNESENEVTVYALVERNGNLMIDTAVNHRLACRSFRLDRVQSARDADTGEVISGALEDWLKA